MVEVKKNCEGIPFLSIAALIWCFECLSKMITRAIFVLGSRSLLMALMKAFALYYLIKSSGTSMY
jgi:hypothetical protein